MNTEETAQDLPRHLRGDALIVSLENGVDNVERMRMVAGLDAIAAVVYVASSHATYSEAVAIPEVRELIRQLVTECVVIAQASGVRLPAAHYVQMVWDFAETAGDVYSSTAQDLERGRHTEIDALNGFVVRRGASLQVPTPVNQAMFALVKLREMRGGFRG